MQAYRIEVLFKGKMRCFSSDASEARVNVTRGRRTRWKRIMIRCIQLRSAARLRPSSIPLSPPSGANVNLCIHSHATHNYLLNDSVEFFNSDAFLSFEFSSSVYCVPCAIFSQSLFRVVSTIHEMNKMAQKMKGLP